jgi:enediyne biosynthesis protein E4
MFEVLGEEKKRLYFVNKLKPTQNFNMVTYMYFYNGAGIGAGDIDIIAENLGLNSKLKASNKQPVKL